MEIMRIQDRPHNNRWFVVLVALSFWIWLAKDLVFEIVPVELPTGQLLTVLLVVLALLFLAGRPGITCNERTSRSSHLKSRIAVLFFFCYCVLSGFLSGETAFTVFKLQNLLIGIVVAYALAYKTIRAISMDKRLFLIVGLLVGLAGYYFVFPDLRIYETESIGLRAMNVAHLNIQDFYVVLFLYAATLLFAGDFRRLHLFLFLGTGALSAPIVIAFNSRMLPFVLGVTFVYMSVALRSVMSNHGALIRNVLLLGLLALAGTVFAGDFLRSESRMMSIFDVGVKDAFLVNDRYISFGEAVRNFRESPVYGIGFGKFIFPGSYSDPTDRLSGTWPHNIFLELLSELGIIGFLLFAFSFGITLKEVLFAQIKSNREFLAFPCLVSVYVFATVQLTHHIIYPPLWVGYFCCDAAFHYNRCVLTDMRSMQPAESS